MEIHTQNLTTRDCFSQKWPEFTKAVSGSDLRVKNSLIIQIQNKTPHKQEQESITPQFLSLVTSND
jgi:hypothetical protein